jgi:broad specificity phosphatase PhoE
MRIILLRHGDAVNSTGKFHGWIDNPLTSKGAQEANDISEQIRQYNPSKIITSPMSRARDTANIIGSKLGIPVEANNALMPLNLGDYDGKPVESNLDKVRTHFANPNKQFPNGETVNNWAQNRFIPFFNKHLYSKDPGTIAMMTHGRNIILADADIKMGNNLNFDKKTLLDNKQSTEHGGMAIATPNSFEILNPKNVQAGQS